jgi:hypothetical protein
MKLYNAYMALYLGNEEQQQAAQEYLDSLEELKEEDQE